MPSFALAPLLSLQHPDLAKELNEMTSLDVAIVNLHYKSEGLLKRKGFGMFVPDSENSLVRDEGNDFDLNEAKLLETSLQHVNVILNISESPDNFKVNILRKSFPQYNVNTASGTH
jgi:protoporphyrinogen oxidase